MTTLAWDGSSLAVDSLVTAGAAKWGQVRKIARVRNAVCAFTGSVAGGLLLLEWYGDGAEPGEFPRLRADGFAELVVVREGKCLHFESTHMPSEVQAPAAWGTGREYALGALAAGATARQAVQIAARYDALTGGLIHAYRTR